LQANSTIEKLQTQLQNQSTALAALTSTVESMTHDVHVLKNPTYDQIFTYIDRQVENVTTDVDRKLAVKADRREMEIVLPQRVEDLYRNMVGKYQELKTDMARTVSKEEFVTVVQNKVSLPQ
jgi:hypothetical protein